MSLYVKWYKELSVNLFIIIRNSSINNFSFLVHNFIRNSYEYGNNRMCDVACDFVLKSNNEKKCHYDDGLLKQIKETLSNCIVRM